MTRRETVAYLAGIIDGEGYIGIKKASGKHAPRYDARVVVRMADRAPLDLLAVTLGGSVRIERARTIGRRLATWDVRGPTAEAAIREVREFLQIKRESADNLLRFREHQGTSANHRTKLLGHRDRPGPAGSVARVRTMALSDGYVSVCEEFYVAARVANARP